MADWVAPRRLFQAESRTGSLKNIGRNAVGNALRCIMDRVARQMSVAGRGFDIAVPQELADHRPGLAERQRSGGEGMKEVVKSDLFQPGVLADALPRSLQDGTCVPEACRR